MATTLRDSESDKDASGSTAGDAGSLADPRLLDEVSASTVGSDGTIDNTASAYIEAPVTLLGFSFSVSPADVTTATIQFALAGQPTAFSL